MRRHKLLALATALFVITLGGAAFSSNQTLFVQLVDFDPVNELVWGHPGANPQTVASYQRTDQTAHLASIGLQFYPPGPCRGQVRAWDNLVAQSGTTGVETRRALTVILGHLADHQCNVITVTDPTTQPPLLIAIQPTP